jgi:predicted nucleotidyltransferase
VEALYTPYIYALNDVKVEEGDLSWRVSEVVSYEGFYGGLAQEGEEVIAYGKVEEVKSSSSKDRLRLLLGSPEAGGRDFLKPLNLCTSEQK